MTGHETGKRIANILLVLLALVLCIGLVYRRQSRSSFANESDAVLPVPGFEVRSVRVVEHSTNESPSAGTARAAPVELQANDRCLLLVHFEADCPFSEQVASEWDAEPLLAAGVRVRWLSSDASSELSRRFVRRFALDSVWWQLDPTMAENSVLRVSAVPSFTLVRDGVLLESALTLPSLKRTRSWDRCATAAGPNGDSER
jgi:hypothetical protein